MGGSQGPESALQLGVQPRGLHGDLPPSPFQAASRDKDWPTKLGYDNYPKIPERIHRRE